MSTECSICCESNVTDSDTSSVDVREMCNGYLEVTLCINCTNKLNYFLLNSPVYLRYKQFSFHQECISFSCKTPENYMQQRDNINEVVHDLLKSTSEFVELVVDFVNKQREKHESNSK